MLTLHRRNALTSDLQAVYEIFTDPSVISTMSFDPLSLDEFRPIFNDYLAPGTLYVWETDGRVIATCVVARHRMRLAHVAYIGSFALRSEYQNSGIGSHILGEIISDLKKQGVLRLELLVESDNPRAIHLYQKFGFEVEGKMRKLLKRSHEAQFVDDYLMSLLL